MTDMGIDAIDELLMELTDYGSNLMLIESLPSEVISDLRMVKGDKGMMVHVTDAIDSVLDLRLLASCVAEEE